MQTCLQTILPARDDYPCIITHHADPLLMYFLHASYHDIVASTHTFYRLKREEEPLYRYGYFTILFMMMVPLHRYRISRQHKLFISILIETQTTNDE